MDAKIFENTTGARAERDEAPEAAPKIKLPEVVPEISVPEPQPEPKTQFAPALDLRSEMPGLSFSSDLPLTKVSTHITEFNRDVYGWIDADQIGSFRDPFEFRERLFALISRLMAKYAHEPCGLSSELDPLRGMTRGYPLTKLAVDPYTLAVAVRRTAAMQWADRVIPNLQTDTDANDPMYENLTVLALQDEARLFDHFIQQERQRHADVRALWDRMSLLNDDVVQIAPLGIYRAELKRYLRASGFSALYDLIVPRANMDIRKATVGMITDVVRQNVAIGAKQINTTFHELSKVLGVRADRAAAEAEVPTSLSDANALSFTRALINTLINNKFVRIEPAMPYDTLSLPALMDALLLKILVPQHCLTGVGINRVDNFLMMHLAPLLPGYTPLNVAPNMAAVKAGQVNLLQTPFAYATMVGPTCASFINFAQSAPDGRGWADGGLDAREALPNAMRPFVGNGRVINRILYGGRLLSSENDSTTQLDRYLDFCASIRSSTIRSRGHIQGRSVEAILMHVAKIAMQIQSFIFQLQRIQGKLAVANFVYPQPVAAAIDWSMGYATNPDIVEIIPTSLFGPSSAVLLADVDTIDVKDLGASIMTYGDAIHEYANRVVGWWDVVQRVFPADPAQGGHRKWNKVFRLERMYEAVAAAGHIPAVMAGFHQKMLLARPQYFDFQIPGPAVLRLDTVGPSYDLLQDYVMRKAPWFGFVTSFVYSPTMAEMAIGPLVQYVPGSRVTRRVTYAQLLDLIQRDAVDAMFRAAEAAGEAIVFDFPCHFTRTRSDYRLENKQVLKFGKGTPFEMGSIDLGFRDGDRQLEIVTNAEAFKVPAKWFVGEGDFWVPEMLRFVETLYWTVRLRRMAPTIVRSFDFQSLR